VERLQGKVADGNPWGATTLEWQTPDTPPRHGNWGPTQPVVYRRAYDYSVPGAARDFIPQNMAPEEAGVGDGGASHPGPKAKLGAEAVRRGLA
jgi:cytochrome c oxidase subunit 1